VIFALLNRFKREREPFGPAQPTADEHGEHGPIASFPRSAGVTSFEQTAALLRSQPVAEADADSADAFHAPNACSEFRD
jgi:hypothetical protein